MHGHRVQVVVRVLALQLDQQKVENKAKEIVFQPCLNMVQEVQPTVKEDYWVLQGNVRFRIVYLTLHSLGK